MAAISNTILAIAKSGENIISGNQLFGHTYALLNQILPEFGLETRFSNLKSKVAISIKYVIGLTTRSNIHMLNCLKIVHRKVKTF